MKPFDLLKAPLAGSHLIEASAGTGKTYAIEGLFLRLVLEKQLVPDSILVVTFTQSATDELKERIYRKLVAMRRVLAGQRSDDKFVTALSETYPEPERGLRLVQEAISEFDRVAIFTIHGFCQRVLYENAVATGKLFDTELIEDQSPLLRLIARDFWRTRLYSAEPEVIAYVLRRLAGPESLLGLMQTSSDDRVRVLPQFDHQPTISTLGALRQAALAVKRRWSKDRAKVQSIFFDPALSGTVFGGIKPKPKAGETSPRALKVAKLVSAMDALTLSEWVVPPLFKDFSKFTSDGIARATRKGQPAPEHEFFHRCDDLAAAASALTLELDAYLAWLKHSALKTSRVELPKRKNALNVQYFDDLLLQVKQALDSPGGGKLVDTVSRRYQAALVDEFQDTDRIQYDIFSQFFSGRDTPLFLIGDPKQAIYGFRGADIFTYMQAARQSQQRHTLLENWRSSPGLIGAINAVFSAAPVPFLFPGIGFEPVKSAGESRPQTGSPMTIWYLDAGEYGAKGRPVAKYVAEPLIVTALAGEITRLLTASEDPATAGDIAVLVRTNRQARLVKEGLIRHSIPAVLHSTGNVFDAPEAADLEILLDAIAHPADTHRVRSALVTRLWGWTAADLFALDADPDAWQGLQQRVLDYHRTWQKSGFMRMFRQLLTREAVAVRLMGLQNGERRLTNLMHLGEILHSNAASLDLNMAALVNWLAEQRDPDTPRQETHQLRMESDADAVKIVTIHKSKGLEYPVVFCPFCWEDSRLQGSQLKFHDPEHGYRPTLHLNAQPDDDCRKWAQNEQLAENLRLLYVALTRAKSRCFVVWGRIRGAETSALAYLLHARIRFEDQLDNTDAVALLSKSMAGRSDADYWADLKSLADRHPDCLSIEMLPVDAPAYLPPRRIDDQLASRRFCGIIDRTRAINSYSTLVAQRDSDADLPDHDDLLRRWHPLVSIPTADRPRIPEADHNAMYAFEKGPRAGIFFHELLEEMNYSPGARESRTALVVQKLAQHGYGLDWKESVTELLQQVLEIKLPDRSFGFCLGQLNPEDRLHELEFYFPLNPLSADSLLRILGPYAKQLPQSAGEFMPTHRLSFSPAGGFMKGFIDLVFGQQGRYYLVDWKSNFLGDTLDDYRRTRLEAAMDEHLYGLQSVIYTLAVDQYLRLRIPDYRYESHFGGAYYIFLRGIRSDSQKQYGVHYSRLDSSALTSLREALIPESADDPLISDGRG